MSFRAACVQFTAGCDPETNVAALDGLIRRARGQGADLIMTPEVSDMMEPRRRLAFEKARPEDEHRPLAAFRELGAELGVWLLIGSVVVRAGPERLANRSFLIDPAGAIVARYDKIHMFDVDLDNGESWRESATYEPGRHASIAPLPFARLGLGICYDVRFPELFQKQALAGADVLSAPAAFTRQTGAAHWHVLLRARAIECGAYVFAPAQCGVHESGRETYGRSLIVAPWGEVLADGGEAPGVVCAEVDPDAVARARSMVPALRHDRPFGAPAQAGPQRAAGE